MGGIVLSFLFFYYLYSHDHHHDRSPQSSVVDPVLINDFWENQHPSKSEYVITSMYVCIMYRYSYSIRIPLYVLQYYYQYTPDYLSKLTTVNHTENTITVQVFRYSLFEMMEVDSNGFTDVYSYGQYR